MGSYYFERDEVGVTGAGDDAYLHRPAGGGEHIPGGVQVRRGDAGPEPEPDLLAVVRGRGGEDDRQPAAPGLHPGVHAARPDPVRRDDAPGPGDDALAGWRPVQQRCCTDRQPGPRGDSESVEPDAGRDQGGKRAEGGENAEFPAPAPGQLNRSWTVHFPDCCLQAGHQAGVVRPARAAGGHQRSPAHGQSGGARSGPARPTVSSSRRIAGSCRSTSNRASRYWRPSPPYRSITSQPLQRASASFIAYSLVPARRGRPTSQAMPIPQAPRIQSATPVPTPQARLAVG
jgi:hypothetical protein